MTTVAGYLAENVSFEGPGAQATGAAAVLETVAPFSVAVTELKIIASLGDDRQALIMYDMVTGSFGALRAAEHLTVKDGKIQTDTLVFDSHEVRKAQAAGQEPAAPLAPEQVSGE